MGGAVIVAQVEKICIKGKYREVNFCKSGVIYSVGNMMRTRAERRAKHNDGSRSPRPLNLTSKSRVISKAYMESR